MPFSDFFQKLAPTSLRRTWGSLFLKGVGEGLDGAADGVVRDDAGNPMTTHIDANGVQQAGAPAADYGIAARARAAVKLRFPDLPLGASSQPSDALRAIASERQLEPGLSSPATLGARLRQAWSIWQFGGTAYGLLLELYRLGYTNVHLAIVNGKAYRLQSATGDVSADLVISALPAQSWWPSPGSSPARTWWTRFAVIFDAPLPTPATGAPSDWTVALPAEASDEVAVIKRVIARWKPGLAICDRIIVLSAGNTWGWPQTLTWGQAGLTWGTPTVTYWSP